MKPVGESMTSGFSADTAQVIDSRTGFIRDGTGPPVDELGPATRSRALTRRGEEIVVGQRLRAVLSAAQKKAA